VSDRKLRELERRRDFGEPVGPELRRERQRLGLYVRDPRRDPMPGDVVRSAYGCYQAERLVVTKEDYKESWQSGNKTCAGCLAQRDHLHWIALYRSRGEQSCGNVQRKGWRYWAKGGSVLNYAEDGPPPRETKYTEAELIRLLLGGGA